MQKAGLRPAFAFMKPIPNDALVEIRNLTFGYGERIILDDVSLRIPRGKVTALMGASGGGKTTALRLIGGQWKAQKGQVLLQGHLGAWPSLARVRCCRGY